MGTSKHFWLRSLAERARRTRERLEQLDHHWTRPTQKPAFRTFKRLLFWIWLLLSFWQQRGWRQHFKRKFNFRIFFAWKLPTQFDQLFNRRWHQFVFRVVWPTKINLGFWLKPKCLFAFKNVTSGVEANMDSVSCFQNYFNCYNY